MINKHQEQKKEAELPISKDNRIGNDTSRYDITKGISQIYAKARENSHQEYVITKHELNKESKQNQLDRGVEKEIGER